MRPRSAAVIALRIFATILTVEVVSAVVSFLAVARTVAGTGAFWAIVGTRLVLAFLLWMSADALATAITGGLVDESPASPRRTVNIHAVALSIVGVVLIAQGLTSLISAAVTETGVSAFSRLRSTTPFAEVPFAGRGAAVLIAFVTLAIGTVLIIASGAIAKGLSARYPEPDNGPPPPPGP